MPGLLNSALYAGDESRPTGKTESQRPGTVCVIRRGPTRIQGLPDGLDPRIVSYLPIFGDDRDIPHESCRDDNPVRRICMERTGQ